MAEPVPVHLFDESEDETNKEDAAEKIQLADIDKDQDTASLQSELEEALDRIVKAAKDGKEEDVRRELEGLSESERAAVLKERDIVGYTALHYAVKNDRVKVVELLIIVYGADPELKTEGWFESECTSLHLAVIHGSLETVKLLLDPKQHATTHETHDRLEPANIDSVDEDGQTPLHYASSKGHAEIVTILLEYGAQVDKADNSGKSPLHVASENNHANVATILLENGADANKGDDNGETPLHQAAGGEVVVCLVEHGADVNKGDSTDQTPLHFACEHENLEVVTTLLEHGADVNKADSSGDTPLQEASQIGDSADEIVTALLKHGADVNIADESGTTPLANACFEGSVKLVNILLEHKADKDKAEKDGTTPMHTACDWGYAEVVTALLNHGADVTKTNDLGLNPLMVAIQEGHEDVAMVFVKHKTWKDALQICCEGNTPMREMIKRMPDVAAEVLDKCTEVSDTFAKGNENFDVTFDYEMVEDFRDHGDDPDDLDFDYYEDRSCLSRFCQCCFPSDGGFASNWGPKGFNRFKHPLYLMSQCDNLKLLKHPLVTTLLRRKWRVTQFVYLTNLLFYCVFLGFLTAFALAAPNPQTERCDAILSGNSTVSAGQSECEQTDGRRAFVFLAGVITIILGIIRLVAETLQLIQLRVDYVTDWVNWMEIIMVIFSIIFVWVFNTDCLCPQRWQWQIGTIAVFLAWTDFIIFVQKLPGVGIYVVMLIDILWIFIKTVPLTIMLVIAFGLGLFMALFEPGVLRSPFATPARSLLSIVTYSTGGFDFDAIFRQAPGGTEEDNDLMEIPFPAVSYIMWIIFIIIMPILLNNLLIGLAVGDINDTLEKAEGKKVALEIELTLSVEASLPTKLRRKFIVGRELLYPNYDLSLREKIEKLFWGADRFPTGTAIAKAVKKEDSDPIKQLPQQTVSLAKDVQEMKKTISSLSSLSQDVQEIKNVVKDLQKVLANIAGKQDQAAP